MKLFLKKYWALLGLIFIYLSLKWLSYVPDFVTNIYSVGIYPKIAAISRIVLGKIPFSVGDMFYFVLIFFLFRWFWLFFKNRATKKRHYFKILLRTFTVVFALFHLLWGINYLRRKLTTELSIETAYTQQELEDFTCQLIEKTNRLHFQITGNDSITYQNPYEIETIFNKSEAAYKQLSQKFPQFEFNHLSTKKSLFSLPLSYMGFSGYLNPFTNEAQVNVLIPKYNMPTTTLHEMSHQIGIANESEANFVGYLASINSVDVHFQYSGYTFALKYCLRNIERFESGRAAIFLAQINAGVVDNFMETERFHEKYDSILEVLSNFWYDLFLKSNKQQDGLEGYNNFVGLMLNYELN
jgi:hypothetical protein